MTVTEGATAMNACQPGKTVNEDDEFFVTRTIDSARITQCDLADLASGVVAAIRVRDFLSPLSCQSTVARIGEAELCLEMYDRARVDPPIARFGPVINDFNESRRIRMDYWVKAERARRAWHAVASEHDPLMTSITQMEEAWGRPVRPARVAGKNLFAGAVREINEGALIHFDDVRREYGRELFDDGLPVVQLAFNTWLSVPSTGGATRIWRRRWRPGDLHHRHGYGYGEQAVDGERSIVLSVQLGDALLFDSRNFHAVDPSTDGRRVALAFFMGLTSRGEMTIWS